MKKMSIEFPLIFLRELYFSQDKREFNNNSKCNLILNENLTL